jgi:hypothetical protein
MAITSTGGYIGRIFWINSAVHPDFPLWGEVHTIPNSLFANEPWGVWAGLFPVIQQIINWRFYD